MREHFFQGKHRQRSANYIWLSLRHWNVVDFTPLLDDPSWFDDDDRMLFVRRISCEAASKRLRSKRTAGLVVMPLRFRDFLVEGNERDFLKLLHFFYCFTLYFSTYFDGGPMSLLLPNIIRICVSRAKWSLFSIFCDEKMVVGASNVSSKFWPLSLPGEIGGVAYNGDMQPISDKSNEKNRFYRKKIRLFSFFHCKCLFRL